MKVLKITTHWTVEEADCVYQLLDELKSALWQSYGEEIVQMHQMIQEEQQERENGTFFDDIPF